MPQRRLENGDKRDGNGSALTRSVFSPQTALLVLIAACNLFLVHAVLVFLLIESPYSPAEAALLWATGFVGIALLVYGGTVAWDTLGRLRSAEARLTETRSRLQALIDASPLAITAEDTEGRTTLWSRTAEQVFGWPAEEVIGTRQPSVPESESAAWESMRRDVLGGKVVTELAGQRVTRDGARLEVSISSAPVRNSAGVVEGTVEVIADVTQRRRTERERQRLEDQLRQAQKMEAVGRLAGGVAHDFNNLLTAIKGHAELLLDGTPTEVELREDLGEITRSTDRAAALTRQLLTFSRQSLVEPRPLDLNLLIREMEKLLRRLLGEVVRLETGLRPDLGMVLADPGQVEQVLMNLVVNARDAMPHGGRIIIRTTNAEITEPQAAGHAHRVIPGHYVLVSVTDNGMGMDPTTAERIFEPFFTTKPVGVGTGLGLSTTYGIVKQARGYIWVDTELGKGTTFMVYLPRVEAEREAVPARLPVAAAPHRSHGSETVLVVEDEEPVLSLARKVLERRGYDVLTAKRGHEAVQHAREHPSDIHLLFCDVVMPDIPGRDISQRVERLRPGIRILMTSGYAEQVVAEQGAVAAGMPFLAKPYTPDSLARAVRDLLGET